MDLLETDDPDWYLVKLSDGQIGLAPSNYLQMEGEHFEDAQEQYEQPQTPIAPPLPPVQPSIPTNTSTPALSSISSTPPAPPLVQPVLSQPVKYKKC
jgi:hypothetical protein